MKARLQALFGRARSRFEALEPREQRTVSIGGAALLLMGLYVFVYEPLYVTTPVLAERLAAREADLAVMERLAQQAGVDTGPTSPGADDRTSLLARVDQVASETGVKASIRRLQPEGNGARIRVDLAAAPFESVALWLGRLDADHGIVVRNLDLERAGAEGRVDGSLVLGR